MGNTHAFTSYSSAALDTPSYSLADLAKVTRLPVGTVRMWLERRILELGQNDVHASGKGSARQFTLRTLYLAATMAEITRLGISPSQAAKWAHIVWRLGANKVMASQDDMVFVASPNSERFRIASRRGSFSEEIIFGASSDEPPSRGEPELSVVVIDVSGVIRKCRNALELRDDSTSGHSSLS